MIFVVTSKLLLICLLSDSRTLRKWQLSGGEICFLSWLWSLMWHIFGTTSGMNKEEVWVAGADRYYQIWETCSSLQPLLPTLTLYCDLTLNPGGIWLTFVLATKIPTYMKHSSHPSSNLTFSYLNLLTVVLQNALVEGQDGESILGHWHFMSFLCPAGEKLHAQDWHAAAENYFSSTNVECITVCLYAWDWYYGIEAQIDALHISVIPISQPLLRDCDQIIRNHVS